MATRFWDVFNKLGRDQAKKLLEAITTEFEEVQRCTENPSWFKGSPEDEANAAKFRAEMLNGDGKPEGTLDSLAMCVRMLNTYAVDCFPANSLGQIHFVRATMESAADEIAAFLASYAKGQGNAN